MCVAYSEKEARAKPELSWKNNNYFEIMSSRKPFSDPSLFTLMRFGKWLRGLWFVCTILCINVVF
jgi:hypothetical protein